jgi:hypothetical protein
VDARHDPISPATGLVSAARFPGVRASAGHYESYYLKACHPEGGLAVWIRYTVHKPPERPPVGAVWFTLFDVAGGVSASKVRFPLPRAGHDEYIAMNGCRFVPGHVVGRAASAHQDATWELRYEGSEPPLRHLPRPWMYRAPLPRTKLLSPHPLALFSGRIELSGRRIDMLGWPGMVGHNWGAEHPRRSIWIHGANFQGHHDTWLDLSIARVGLGPLTTPWIANGALCLHGQRRRLGGLGRVAATRVDESGESCSFRLGGDGIALAGRVGASRNRFVGWEYAQPTGAKRQTINCSIADLRLEVSPAGGAPLTLELDEAATYELQSEERHPDIPLQPFADG